MLIRGKMPGTARASRVLPAQGVQRVARDGQKTPAFSVTLADVLFVKAGVKMESPLMFQARGSAWLPRPTWPVSTLTKEKRDGRQTQ